MNFFEILLTLLLFIYFFSHIDLVSFRVIISSAEQPSLISHTFPS